MAEDPRPAGSASSRRAARLARSAHLSARRSRHGRVLVGAAAGVGVAVAGAWTFGGLGAGATTSSPPDAPAPCPVGRSVLTVAAAPELVPALRAATGAGPGRLLPASASCLTVVVRAAAPAAVAARLSAGTSADPAAADLPDVWVPDSSTWLDQLPAAAPFGDHTPSLASSPVVLAVAEVTARQLGWPGSALDLVGAMGAAIPGAAIPGAADQPPAQAAAVRLGVPDAEGSVATRSALAAVDEAVSARPDSVRALSRVLRAADGFPSPGNGALLVSLQHAPALAVPVPEQAVFTHNRTGLPLAVASYPAGATALDYPLVVLAGPTATSPDVTALSAALSGPDWTELVQQDGFRASDGSVGPALGAQEGLDGGRATGAVPPDPARLEAALRTYRVLTLGTRMLAVVDVSGSMLAPVPGVEGRTRLDLAAGAAAGGLGLYPDDAQIGLWSFSTALTPTGDHRELVPLGPVGTQADGVQGRELLARALAGLAVESHGDTGLYDTTLEAVRAVREGWDPRRVNSVVLMTDGRNDDAGSIVLDELVARLGQEAGERPVPVVAIAVGPDSDVDALRRITDVTGGTTHVVDDVRRIHEVVADALAQRPCRPTC